MSPLNSQIGRDCSGMANKDPQKPSSQEGNENYRQRFQSSRNEPMAWNNPGVLIQGKWLNLSCSDVALLHFNLS